MNRSNGLSSSNRLARACALGLLALALLGARAWADELGPLSPVEKGVALFDDLEYREAATVLTGALGNLDLPTPKRIEALTYLGLAQVALGKENEARDSFRQLLELDRRAVLEDSRSPRARALLEEVRLDLPSEVKISLREPPQGGRAGAPIVLSIRVEDPSSVVDGVVVHFKAGDKRLFDSVGATRVGASGDYSATILSAFVVGPTVRFYVTAQASSGKPVAALASAAQPDSIDVLATAASRSVLKSPILWAGIGVAAVAGGTLAYFLLRSEEQTGFINIIPR